MPDAAYLTYIGFYNQIKCPLCWKLESWIFTLRKNWKEFLNENQVLKLFILFA
jgi:hypothetical protein